MPYSSTHIAWILILRTQKIIPLCHTHTHAYGVRSLRWVTSPGLRTVPKPLVDAWPRGIRSILRVNPKGRPFPSVTQSPGRTFLKANFWSLYVSIFGYPQTLWAPGPAGPEAQRVNKPYPTRRFVPPAPRAGRPGVHGRPGWLGP